MSSPTTQPLALCLMLLIGVATLAPATASAQQHCPVSFEANVGVASGLSSGDYPETGIGYAGDVLLGLRLAPARGGNAFAALSLSAQGSVFIEEGLGIDPPSQRIPDFTSAALLAGWENRSSKHRLLTGPAVARAYGIWDVEFAWLARFDSAPLSRGHAALTVSLRALFVPSYTGDTFFLVSAGAGFRIR